MGGSFGLRASVSRTPPRWTADGCARHHSALRGIVIAATVALSLSACGERNSYVPPPPPKVELALPLQQTVTRYLTATGNVAAINSTTLVARVQGFVQEIKYNDGDAVKAGTLLFVIE